MRQRIAIVVAMDKEYELLKPLLLNPSLEQGEGHSYIVGTLGDAAIALHKCCIGKVNAAVGVTELIRDFAPTAVVSTGVAGTLRHDMGSLDVVIAESCAYHDVYCGTGQEYGQVQGMPAVYHADESLLQVADNTVGNARTGLVVSGDVFIDNETAKHKILAAFPDALAVDMESCAIAHVCHLKEVPFIAIRIISDGCDMADYGDFWKRLADKSFASTAQFIRRLSNR